jgi:hypothetical protein
MSDLQGNVTKSEVGWWSALRAAATIAVAVAGVIVSHPEIKTWRDLLDFKTVLAIVIAIGGKGLLSGAAAKDVTIKQ